MKKLLTCLCLFVGFLTQAQVNNGGFELWTSRPDTFSYDPYISRASFNDTTPVDWTTTNVVTGHPTLGATAYVIPSADAQYGQQAVQLQTVDINVLGLISLTVPGFAVSGNFFIDLKAIVDHGGQVNPAQLSGAGTPISGIPQSLHVHAKFKSVGNDSLLLWGALRLKDTLIGEAKLSLVPTDTNYHWYHINYSFVHCGTPDTQVIMFASGNPNFGSLLSGGASGLHAGSILLVDTSYSTAFSGAVVYPPITSDDRASTLSPRTVVIRPLLNDIDCGGTAMHVSSITTAHHGTAILSNDSVYYTPAAGYNGQDTLSYTAAADTFINTAKIYINILSSGISSTSEATSFSISQQNNALLLSALDDHIQYQLIDITGKMVQSDYVGEGEHKNIVLPSTGIYLLYVKTSLQFYCGKFTAY
jgi:hypothetical protein